MIDPTQASNPLPAGSAPSIGSWLPSKIYLIDRSEPLVDEWRTQFAECAAVEVMAGDYFAQPADAIVSPANSFGIMDGGLDLAIRNQLGASVERKLQEVIVEKYHGELPVGCAEIVETNHPRWPLLISAPTMRVPEPVGFTLNAYLAFRAILLVVESYNKERGRRDIDSMVCCGLGTGIGNVSGDKCARQMRAAYQVMKAPARIPSFQAIHQFHEGLLRA